MRTTNFSKSFFKHILLHMKGRMSKIRSLHTHVIPRTVYFDWICTFMIKKALPYNKYDRYYCKPRSVRMSGVCAPPLSFSAESRRAQAGRGRGAAAKVSLQSAVVARSEKLCALSIHYSPAVKNEKSSIGLVLSPLKYDLKGARLHHSSPRLRSIRSFSIQK